MSNQIGLAKKQRIVPDLNNPKGEYVFLTWDDIEFDKDQFAIRPQQVGRIFKPVPLKGSLLFSVESGTNILNVFTRIKY
ncbi:MAG: hypothetical protein ICV79_27230 [Flavisolibacter sp.]|nr:hypothetical protein [Flavisolibacter sp.]